MVDVVVGVKWIVEVEVVEGADAQPETDVTTGADCLPVVTVTELSGREPSEGCGGLSPQADSRINAKAVEVRTRAITGETTCPWLWLVLSAKAALPARRFYGIGQAFHHRGVGQVGEELGVGEDLGGAHPGA